MRGWAVAFSILGFCACGPGRSLSNLTVGMTSHLRVFGCVLDDTGVVWCWDDTGDPTVYGGFITGHSPATPFAVEGLPRVTSIAAGVTRVWASSEEGPFWWGEASLFAPGPSHVVGSLVSPVRFEGVGAMAGLATTGETTCVLVGPDGLSWGDSAAGETGAFPPDEPGVFRNKWLPARKVRSGARAVSMRYRLVCATLLDDTLSCWGGGHDVPDHRDTDRVARWENDCVLTNEHQLSCGGPPPFEASRTFKQLGRREGAYNTGNCVEDLDGEVFCWDVGLNDGQAVHVAAFANARELAMPSFPLNNVASPSPTACALMPDETVRCVDLRDLDAGVQTITWP